jgi:hypothetical protein
MTAEDDRVLYGMRVDGMSRDALPILHPSCVAI